MALWQLIHLGTHDVPFEIILCYIEVMPIISLSCVSSYPGKAFNSLVPGVQFLFADLKMRIHGKVSVHSLFQSLTLCLRARYNSVLLYILCCENHLSSDKWIHLTHSLTSDIWLPSLPYFSLFMCICFFEFALEKPFRSN